jgi:O-antigen/teichoic acid export membrane protein
VRDWWSRWRAPVAASVTDQVLVSGAHLVLHVLLARWTSTAAYGAFAVSFAGFLIATGVHGALLLEPLSVRGPQTAEADRTAYLRSLLVLHFWLTVPPALVAACVLRLLAPAAVGATWVAMALAAPVLLLLWLLRAAAYAFTRPGLAAEAAAVYAATLGVGLVLMRGAPGATRAVGLMAAGALLASAGLAFRLRLFGRPRAAAQTSLGVWREHWLYGRWILAASAGHHVAHGLYVPLAGAMLGLAGSAALRAAQNPILPIQQLLSALCMLALPWLAREEPRQGHAYFRRSSWRLLGANSGLAAAYGFALALVGPLALRLLYGAGRYAELAWALWWVAAAATVGAAAQALSVLARAANRPQAVLWSKIAAAVALVTVGIPALWLAGLAGAFAAPVLVSACEAGVLGFMMRDRLARAAGAAA